MTKFSVGDIVVAKEDRLGLALDSGKEYTVLRVTRHGSLDLGITDFGPLDADRFDAAPIRVGDTVECINSGGFRGLLSEGKSYVVRFYGKSAYDDDMMVGLSKTAPEWRAVRFKRIAPAAPAFALNTAGPHDYKPGDTVVCVADRLHPDDNTGWYFGEIGKEYVVEGSYGRNGSGDVKFVGGGGGDRRRFKLVRRKAVTPQPAAKFEVGDRVRVVKAEEFAGGSVSSTQPLVGKEFTVKHATGHNKNFPTGTTVEGGPRGHDWMWSLDALELVKEDTTIATISKGDTLEVLYGKSDAAQGVNYGERYIVEAYHPSDGLVTATSNKTGRTVCVYANRFKKVQPQPARAASKETPMPKPTSLADLKDGDRFEIVVRGTKKYNSGSYVEVEFDGTQSSNSVDKAVTVLAIKQIDVQVKAGQRWTSGGSTFEIIAVDGDDVWYKNVKNTYKGVCKPSVFIQGYTLEA